MSDRDAVLRAAEVLGLMAPGGEALQKLDSLTIIDFVIELEKETGLEIPTTALREEVFESIEAVTAMLATLRS